MDQNNYVAPTADGRFVVVVNGETVGTFGDQGEAERAFNAANRAQPTTSPGFASSKFQTPNGPKTLDEMRAELAAQPWDGDPSNAAAVLDAYRRTAGGGANRSGRAGSATTGSSTTGNSSIDAFLDQIAQGNRERYDEMVRQFNQTTRLGEADRTGYLEGAPTLAREQSEFNRQAATGYVRYDPALNRPQAERPTQPSTSGQPSMPGTSGQRQPDGTYQTPNGSRTVDQMRSELRGANWDGNPDDEQAVVDAYRRTASQSGRR